jgi:uncharacterized protein with PIN domain
MAERQSDLSSLTETDYGAISRREPMRMSAAKSHPRTHARALKAGDAGAAEAVLGLEARRGSMRWRRLAELFRQSDVDVERAETMTAEEALSAIHARYGRAQDAEE